MGDIQEEETKLTMQSVKTFGDDFLRLPVEKQGGKDVQVAYYHVVTQGSARALRESMTRGGPLNRWTTSYLDLRTAQPMPQEVQEKIPEVLKEIERNCNIVFVRTNNAASANLLFLGANSIDPSWTGFGELCPHDPRRGYAAWSNGAQCSDAEKKYVVLHELMHALGASHPRFYTSTNPKVPIQNPLADPASSVMSYFDDGEIKGNSAFASDITSKNKIRNYDSRRTLSPLDIAWLRKMFGEPQATPKTQKVVALGNTDYTLTKEECAHDGITLDLRNAKTFHQHSSPDGVLIDPDNFERMTHTKRRASCNEKAIPDYLRKMPSVKINEIWGPNKHSDIPVTGVAAPDTISDSQKVNFEIRQEGQKVYGGVAENTFNIRAHNTVISGNRERDNFVLKDVQNITIKQASPAQDQLQHQGEYAVLYPDPANHRVVMHVYKQGTIISSAKLEGMDVPAATQLLQTKEQPAAVPINAAEKISEAALGTIQAPQPPRAPTTPKPKKPTPKDEGGLFRF